MPHRLKKKFDLSVLKKKKKILEEPEPRKIQAKSTTSVFFKQIRKSNQMVKKQLWPCEAS